MTGTAVELHGKVTLDNEPKTTRSKRTIPIARAVMRRIEQHLDDHIDPASDSLVLTALNGGPLYRSWAKRSSTRRPKRRVAGHHVSRPPAQFRRHHGGGRLQREGVSQWAGHDSVAFTLTRYSGLFEDGADDAIERLDALRGPV